MAIKLGLPCPACGSIHCTAVQHRAEHAEKELFLMTQPCTHKFDLMAESRQANHYWCEKCGAYKRVPSGDHEDDQETTISLPKKS